MSYPVRGKGVNMKYVFLFSGQGSQFKGMAEDICKAYPAARAVVDEMSSITGEDIAELLWHTEKEELSRSDKSQLAITAVECAVLAVLKDKGITPSAAAGFSLGEFPALYASGVLDFESTVRIVQKRGRIMQKSCEEIAAASAGKTCGMAAVIRLDAEKITELLAPYSNPETGSVFAANMNSPAQTVVSGTAEGLDRAEALCKEAGAKRFIRLAVAGPFHSPLMKNAAAEFETALEDFTFSDPKIPLFSNVTGKRLLSGSEAKKNAVLHITHPVLWTAEEKEIVSLMNTEQIGSVFEIGPGNTLCNLWRDGGYSDTVCLPTGTAESLDAVLSARLS